MRSLFDYKHSYAQYITRTVVCSAGNTYKNSDITLSYVAGEAIGGLLK